LESLNKASGGKAEPLWQDNWDDDDVEDDFTKQLRYVSALDPSFPLSKPVDRHTVIQSGLYGLTTWVNSSIDPFLEYSESRLQE